MKKTYILLTIALLGLTALAFVPAPHTNVNGFISGSPEIKSISALSFGPDGILFIGDSKSAVVFAVDTKDISRVDAPAPVELKNIDQKIASLLGTTPQNISITDIAVNPLSKKIYCAVQSADGTPVLFTVSADKIEPVALKNIMYSQIALNNPPAEDAKDKRGNSVRVSTISDLGFDDGKVLVSGLSNQEFSSTFRSIPFPFTDKQDWASLEIYHAAHKRYETTSPVNTFTTASINGKKYLVASYTCTPLVLFPLDELKAGAHVKGRTVAEMGAGNRPLDMVTLKKDGELYLMLSNSNRPVFKVKYKNIDGYTGSLTTPVEESFATAGVAFISLPVVSVLQMDKFDDGHMIMVQRQSNGDLNLVTSGDWLL